MSLLYFNIDDPSILSSGLRGRQLIRGIAGSMMMTGVGFGLFLAVGLGIRCEPATQSAVITKVTDGNRAF